MNNKGNVLTSALLPMHSLVNIMDYDIEPRIIFQSIKKIVMMATNE